MRRGDEHFGFRGRTFAPAVEWQEGGREFAKQKLEQVAAMLVEFADAEEARPRRRWWCFWRGERSLARRVDWQRVHDLIDAARTVSDARYALGGPMAAAPSAPPPKPDPRDQLEAQLEALLLDQANLLADEWPFDDDPPDPL